MKETIYVDVLDNGAEIVAQLDEYLDDECSLLNKPLTAAQCRSLANQLLNAADMIKAKQTGVAPKKRKT